MRDLGDKGWTPGQLPILATGLLA